MSAPAPARSPMPLPFTRTNFYTTELSPEQLLALLGRLAPIKGYGQFYAVDNYVVELKRTGFILRNADPRHNLPVMPPIVGEITQAHPTTLRVTIAPNYFLVAFLLLFPTVFVLAALFSTEWTIDGIPRAPVLSERLSLLLSAGLPIVMCYVVAILPVKKAEAWLVKKLAPQ